MDYIKKLLWDKKYDECLMLCKEKLNEDSANAGIWYSMFLASNRNFTESLDEISDELSYEKALDLSSKEERNSLEISYSILRDLKSVPLLANLYLAIQSNMDEAVLEGFSRMTFMDFILNQEVSQNFINALIALLLSSNASRYKLYQMFVYLISVHFSDPGLDGIRNRLKKDGISSHSIREYIDKWENTDLKPGNLIEFGTYAGEPLKWRVLEVKGKQALILTNEIVEAVCFDTNRNNYVQSGIRHYLNEGFCDEFTIDEMERVVKTDVDNGLSSTEDKKNKYISCDTCDLFFLLSVQEAKYYFKTSSLRTCTGTMHAKGNGLYVSGNGNSIWWLRSPGYNNSVSTRVVCVDGEIRQNFVNYAYSGIRPACVISMEHYEKRKKDILNRVNAERLHLDEEKNRRLQAERLQKLHTEEEAERKQAEEKMNQRKAWESQNLCQYCGGSFKGLFVKKCSLCGKKKDYR